MNRLEQQIHRATGELLIGGAVPNCFWFHAANGGWGSPTKAKVFKSLGFSVGVPILILIHKGKTYGLELKPEGGRLTPEQKNCHLLMREAGANVETAYGIEQAIEQLAAWGLLRSDVKVGRERSDIMARSVGSFELSPRVADALRNANILTIGQLVARTEKELLTIPYFGRKSLLDVKKKLSDLGVTLAPHVP